MENFVIPAEVETIGTGAFSDCKALSGFAVPEAVTEIPDYCFSKCSFTELHLGPQVTHIGDGAFPTATALRISITMARPLSLPMKVPSRILK